MSSESDDDQRTVSRGVDTDAATDSEQLREHRRRGATLAPSPDERYRLLELLGEGGMGEVIAAHDTILGREVAIKRMRSSAPTAVQISRFLREAQIQGRLDHPTIPPVHELAHDDRGLPYFVMKRLTGMTLAKIIDRLAAGDLVMHAKFPRQRLLRAFVDICLAIELAHTRGIIHRDIKPANIMLGEFGEVFMLDWGVAKIIGDFDPWTTHHTPSLERTALGTVIGTPGYMSPEQRRGEEVDASADVYALGCVLFEILTLRRVSAESQGPLHPIQHDPDASPELDALCATATASSAPVRSATARELGEATQRFLDGDRDLVLRKRLADDHYRRAARAAVARELEDDQQRVAIREGGRALALDPTHVEAAQLVSWLMLEPPRRLPDELTQELERETRGEVTRQARLAIGAYVALGWFIPHMIWSGVRRPVYLVVFICLLGLLIGHAALGIQRVRYPRAAQIATLAFCSTLVVLVARMYSPFIIAPGIATLIGVVLMSSAMFRTRRLMAIAIAMLSLAVVVPYGLEAIGVLQPTMELTGDTLVISHLAVELPAIPTGLGLVGFSSGLIGIATVLSFAIASRDANARRQLQIQAWQLRQLVPETGVTLPTSRDL